MFKNSYGYLAIALIMLSLGISPIAAQIPIETEPSNSPTEVKPNQSPQPVTARFSCQYKDGQYTVMYQPKSRPGQFFAWAVPSAMGGGWAPDRRCNEISRRLEQYRPDGLIEMRTSTENSYNVICATSEKNNACRIVLTVPVGADPNTIRDRVFGNLTTADSGQTTVGVNTFVEGSSSLAGLAGLLGRQPMRTNSYRADGIDLKPYLDPADGGTGAQLGSSRGLRFKPNNF